MDSYNDDFFKDSGKQLRWYDYFTHGGFYIFHAIRYFFSNPFREEKHELRLMDLVQSLLSDPESATPDNLQKCRQLAHLHRIVENTKARRRLEKWSLRVIAIYLFTVLLIVAFNYFHANIPPILGFYIHVDIPRPIMITILSTTTVNIIGLGLIVLRGHFLAKEDIPDDYSSPHNNGENVPQQK